MALVGEGLRGGITVLVDVLLLQAGAQALHPSPAVSPQVPSVLPSNHFPGPEPAQVWGGDSQAHASQRSQGLGVLQGSQSQGLTLGTGDLTLGCPAPRGCACASFLLPTQLQRPRRGFP